jgi:hypothetical protein
VTHFLAVSSHLFRPHDSGLSGDLIPRTSVFKQEFASVMFCFEVNNTFGDVRVSWTEPEAGHSVQSSTY